MKSAALLNWLATKKTAELPWGGSSFLFHLAGARLGNNLASQLEAHGQISEGAPKEIQNPIQKRPPEKSKISILEVVTKNCYAGFGSSWEKALHRKSKILIKGDVSKFRYFQHACQSGADQFTYPIERCLHLACIRSLAEQQTPRSCGKRFTQTLVRVVLDYRRGWMQV